MDVDQTRDQIEARPVEHSGETPVAPSADAWNICRPANRERAPMRLESRVSYAVSTVP